MFGWGVADFIQGVAIRRIGTAMAMLIRNVMTLIITISLGIFLYSVDRLKFEPYDFLVMVSSSALYVSGYLYYMRGFEHGKSSVVAPIASAYAIVTVLLSIFFNNETLSVIQWFAVIAMITGVSFVSVNLRETKSFWRQPGIKEALMALSFFGFAFYVAGFAAQSMQGEVAFLVSGFSQSVMFLTLSFVIGAKLRSLAGQPLKLFGTFIIHAILVNGAWVAYLYGAALGNISIVASVSSVFSGITAILGIAVSLERLSPTQYLGITMILGGVAVVSF